MKEVLIDINELTDSREMYQSKPHSFIWIFTYILVAIIAAALIWAFFGQKEVVVKANGQVRPELGISTVRNSVAGEVESVSYKQGMTVKAGDILYTIKHDSLIVEKEAQAKRLDESTKELANLQKYRDSIISGVNSFNEKTEPEYYEKVRKLLMDIQYSQTDTNYQITKLNEQSDINTNLLAKNKDEIDCLKKYVKSLDENKNNCTGSTDIERQYSQRYQKYVISQADINRKFDTQSNGIKSNSFDALKQTLEEEKGLQNAYTILKKCIEDSINYFAVGNRYYSLYTDYEFKLTSLKNACDEQQRIYDAYVALNGIAISQSQLNEAKAQLQKAQGDYLSFKTNYLAEVIKTINDKQVRVKQLESQVSGTLDEQTSLKLNESDRKNAIQGLYISERQAATDAIDKLTDNISSLKLSIALDAAQLKTIADSSGDITGLNYSLVERTKSQEIVSTDDRIKAVTDNITTIQQNIKKVQLDIDNAIVRASIDGTVNVLAEMYAGDLAESGKNVLTIIPDKNSAFTMQIYVNNKDIGEIHVGDKVKYSFAALPYREYGQLIGTITSISKDAMINETSGQSFYMVEATVPATKLISESGKQGDIKVGMLCEANVITQQKSFLKYFLEKINLLD